MIPIHTLPILRNEIRVYKSLIKERDKLIMEYENALKSKENKIAEYQSKLIDIGSPNFSEEPGGTSTDTTKKYNYLLEKEYEAKKELEQFKLENEYDYKLELSEWMTRIETVDYYLSLIENPNDKQFIIDFYMELSKKECMTKYQISNINSLYRKADSILKKILKSYRYV